MLDPEIPQNFMLIPEIPQNFMLIPTSSITNPHSGALIPSNVKKEAFQLPFLRRERDSNPRYLSVRRFSRPVQSTTLPPLLRFLYCLRKWSFLLTLQRYIKFVDCASVWGEKWKIFFVALFFPSLFLCGKWGFGAVCQWLVRFYAVTWYFLQKGI